MWIYQSQQSVSHFTDHQTMMYIYIYIHHCLMIGKYIYIYIMIINKYILYICLIHGKYYSATKGFMKFITTFIRQLRRWNEIENRKCDVCMCVYGCRCVCVYMGVGVCVCVWMRVFKLSQARNVKRWLYQKWITNV